MKKKMKVASICVHNSCRSQMAEVLGKHLGKDVFESSSAGKGRRFKMSATRIMGMIKDFLEGNVKADTFSFDLPDALIEFGSAMKRSNPALYELLNEELPDICSYYEPNTDERSERPEYLDENEFRGKVQQIYNDALKLI